MNGRFGSRSNRFPASALLTAKNAADRCAHSIPKETIFMSRRVMNGKMPVWFVMTVALAFAAELAHAQSTKQLIVKFRDAGTPQTLAATTSRLSRFTTDAAAAGVPLRPLRAMALGAHVMTL